MIFVIDATAMLILYCLSVGLSCLLVLLSYRMHVLDRLCISESRSFLEFCMDMRFVDLICMISSSEGYLDLPQANLCRLRINTFLTNEFQLRSHFFIIYQVLGSQSNVTTLQRHATPTRAVTRYNQPCGVVYSFHRHSIHVRMWSGILS